MIRRYGGEVGLIISLGLIVQVLFGTYNTTGGTR